MIETADTPAFSVSGFVAVLNQTLEYAYPTVLVTGELAQYRVSKNRWVYFDLKDEQASLRCFATVYQLPGPLENGMLLTVRAQPRVHPLYNFSLQVQAMQVSGEGSLRRAADLLAAQLTKEGLFAAERKRPLPYPPTHIGLITSTESAAYADFVKILGERWGGVRIDVLPVQVQGEPAVPEIVRAVERFNAAAQPPEVLVLTRGGGSADDLAAFSAEPVVRAVAASRIPTLVAIGHEIDTSLAELAADRRASTPSNAAEILVPDRRAIMRELDALQLAAARHAGQLVATARTGLADTARLLQERAHRLAELAADRLQADHRLLRALDPAAALGRGYVLLRQNGQLVRTTKQLRSGPAAITFADGAAPVILEVSNDN